LNEHHWGLFNYLRGEYLSNAKIQLNDRTIVKAISEA